MTEIIISIVGLVLVALSLGHTARTHRRTTDAQMFLEFTSRFNGLTAFREQIAHDNLREDYRKSPSLDNALSSYFDLVSQDFHLNKQGVLSEGLWNLWQHDIKQIVDTPLMRQA